MHTGAIMKFGDGEGAPQSISRKQKLNTKSSTKSELVGADDVWVMILWTKLFLEEQGYEIEKNTLYQDNKSAILLEINGKKSSGKRTRALNIRYFFLTEKSRRRVTYRSNIARLMIWSGISIRSHYYMAKSFASSEMRYSDANYK
jgi:hypothetical protein